MVLKNIYEPVLTGTSDATALLILEPEFTIQKMLPALKPGEHWMQV
jgi:hypothetical protein